MEGGNSYGISFRDSGLVLEGVRDSGWVVVVHGSGEEEQRLG